MSVRARFVCAAFGVLAVTVGFGLWGASILFMNGTTSDKLGMGGMVFFIWALVIGGVVAFALDGDGR